MQRKFDNNNKCTIEDSKQIIGKNNDRQLLLTIKVLLELYPEAACSNG